MTRPRIAALVLVTGCAAATVVPAARFANAPAVQRVDDRRDVATPPAPRLFLPELYHYDGIFQRRLTRALELPRARRALGVNALDEVPDSTWFTNRIGVQALTPAQIRRGPLTHDSPELHRPWTVRSSKVGGSSLGLIIKDTRGDKFLVKFDTRGHPEIETATHVIVNRLMWAAGYHVAEDQIVYLRPDDLVVGPDAKRKRIDGRDDGPLTRADLDRALAGIEVEPDGRLRALVSRWIDGKTLGGHPAEGVRRDDPNDRIPHELRRDLRGARPIFAWVDHVDVQEGNFLDSWATDPADPARHYVTHYLIDFGKSLGGMAELDVDWRRGHNYLFDLRDIAWTFATLGMTDRAWQHRPMPTLRGVGLFDATTFDPAAWRPDSPAYLPFLTADRIDRFWGAKIVARFTRAQLRAAVEAGALSDPRAADYLVDTLVARQRAVARDAFARVNPLDRFAIAPALDGRRVCFEDLAIAGGHTPADHTRYVVTAFDAQARPFGVFMAAGALDGHACAPLVLVGADADAGYTILRIATVRARFAGETFVHVARDLRSGEPRVIGVWRP